MVVWSEEENIRSENRLTVVCVFSADCNRIGMGLQKRNPKPLYKSHGEGRIASGRDELL